MSASALFLALLLPVAGVQERTRVAATLSQSSISTGETVVLSISVETSSAADIHIKVPAFPPSIIVTGSQESSQTQFSIPGGRKRIVTRELALQAVSAGTLAIPAIEIDVGGSVHHTRPLRLQVTGSGVRSPGFTEDEAWLRVTMSPDTVYVGEQATLIAEAGFSEEVRQRMTRQPIFELPSPTGFWAQDLPGGVRTQLRQQDGRVIEVQTMKRAYFPLNAGRYAFAPARMVVDVRQGFLYAPETREVRSASPRLTVLSLPEAGEPAEFRGAVGRYTIRSTVEPRTVGAGEPVQLTLHISGTGNIKAVPPPVLPQMLGAEVFAPTESAETRVENETVGGTKSFTYVLIPEREGVLRIPPIRFAYFDPDSRVYQVLQTDTAAIRVMPPGAVAEEGVAATALYPLRAQPARAGLDWVRSLGFALLQVLPLVLIGLLLLARRQPKPPGPRAHYLNQLRAARQLPDADVYRELDRILRAALQDAVDAAPAAVSGAREMLARIEAARFAPTPPADLERELLLNDAERTIAALFDRARAAKAVVPLLLLASLTVTQSTTFETGTAAYARADYAQAATAFSEHVRAAPRDVSGWYNLGNAEYRLGETGNAIWAWASALRLNPRARDIAHNLRLAGAVEALSVRPPLAVRAEEWLLLAAALWWLAAFFILWTVARGRRPPAWLAAPLLLALSCALLGSVQLLRDARAAVTLRAQTPLYSELTIRSPVFRQVRAGSLVHIRAERDEWLRVTTIDDRSAWVARDDVAEIETK